MSELSADLGSYLESYEVIPKRNYYGAHGYCGMVPSKVVSAHVGVSQNRGP